MTQCGRVKAAAGFFDDVEYFSRRIGRTRGAPSRGSSGAGACRPWWTWRRWRTSGTSDSHAPHSHIRLLTLLFFFFFFFMFVFNSHHRLDLSIRVQKRKRKNEKRKEKKNVFTIRLARQSVVVKPRRVYRLSEKRKNVPIYKVCVCCVVRWGWARPPTESGVSGEERV